MEVCIHSQSRIYTHSNNCLMSGEYQLSIMHEKAHSLYVVFLTYTCKYLLNVFVFTLDCELHEGKAGYEILIVWRSAAD